MGPNMDDTRTAKVSVYYEESRPEGAPDFSLLLLHGRGHCSKVWSLGGVMESLASHGHRAVAIDLPGDGKGRIIESINGDPGRDRYPILIQSIIEELHIERVILVACGCSATYVLDFLNRNNGSESDVLGCILCSPDLSDITDMVIGIDCEVPILMLDQEVNDQIIMTSHSVHELSLRPHGTPHMSHGDLWPVKRPRAFVEKTLLFLSRLQTTEV